MYVRLIVVNCEVKATFKRKKKRKEKKLLLIPWQSGHIKDQKFIDLQIFKMNRELDFHVFIPFLKIFGRTPQGPKSKPAIKQKLQSITSKA